MRALPLIALLLGACNLTLDLDDYTYAGGASDQGVIIIPADMAADMRQARPDMTRLPDMSTPPDMITPPLMDMAPALDMTPPPPQLIFTEVLVDAGEGNNEPGEFFELYNAGSGDVNLRTLCLRISKEKGAAPESMILNGPFYGEHPAIQRPLAPGEFILFIRGEGADPNNSTITAALVQGLATDRYVLYGQQDSSFFLGNSGVRNLEVINDPFCNGEDVLDRVRWKNRSFYADTPGELLGEAADPSLPGKQNRSFALNPAAYDPLLNDALTSWCLTLENPRPISGESDDLLATPLGDHMGECQQSIE